MNWNIYLGDDLQACRVCLATDVKLFNLQKYSLIQMYFECSGTPRWVIVPKNTNDLIMVTDGLPQHICSFCYALLKKSLEFRDKCKNAHTLLLKHLLYMPALTASYLETVDRSHLKPSLTTSATNISSIQDGEDVNIAPEIVHVKEEYQVDNDSIDFTFIDDDSKHDYDDPKFDKDEVKSEDETLLALKEELQKVSKQKRKKKKNYKHKDNKTTEDRVKEFENRYLKNIKDGDKKVFYEHVLEKYVKDKKKQKKTKDRSPKDIPKIKTEDNPLLISIDNGNVNENAETRMLKIAEVCENEENTYRKRFYEHIIEKYGKDSTSTSNQKITDIAQMRETAKEVRSKRTKDDLEAFCREFNVDVAVLSREEQIQDILKRKETDKYKKATFKCEDCYRGFSSEKSFQNHKALHDPSTGPHECEICRVRFAKAAARRKHVNLRHTHTYTCRLCGQLTRSSTNAREHYRCHAGVSYPCEHCGKIFSKYASRINHIRIFHGSVTCDVCRECFTSENGLTTHKTKAHREVFKCAMCGVQFHNSDAVRRHTEALLGQACGAHIRPCTQCGDNFPDEETLTAHMLEYHNRRKHTAGRTQPKHAIKLSSSPKPGVRWRARRGPRPPDADDVDPATLGAVKKRPVKKFMCEMCAKDGFSSEAVLRYHQRIHTGERPHACPHCPKRFRINELLQAHLRTHTGVRPFSCTRCPKAFKTASQLHVHQTVHTKIRRHRCPVCDKAFLTSTCVNTHVRTVHMKLPQRRTPAEPRKE